MKTAPFRRVLQTLTFFRKETVDILRQPRLLVMMVFGPLLVMAAFGLGYDDQPEPLRTVFVVPPGSAFADKVDTYASELDSVELVGTTSDQAVADQMLADDEADLAVTFPAEPLRTVLGGERALVSVLHNRLDPIEQTAISFATALAVNRINAEILSTVVREGQDAAGPAGEVMAATSTAMTALDDAARANDPVAWSGAVDRVNSLLDRLDASLLASAVTARQLAGQGDELSAALDALHETVGQLDRDQPPGPETEATIAAARTNLDAVTTHFGALTSVDPAVLVQPLRGETFLSVAEVDDVTDWYAPAAVILMLQQFGVAFGALSFVRERQLGIDDVLRVAPVGPVQTVVGKYLGYLLIGGMLGAALTTALVLWLDVPLAGSIAEIAAVMALVLFASIGLGLVLSLASASDAQAVQYTMVLLLASLFFSGFFLSLLHMEGVASAISWALPATYGMSLLRAVMLRGSDLDPELLGGLAIYGAVAFVLALLGARRRLRTARVSVA